MRTAFACSTVTRFDSPAVMSSRLLAAVAVANGVSDLVTITLPVPDVIALHHVVGVSVILQHSIAVFVAVV